MKKYVLVLLSTLITPIALCQQIDVEKRTRDAIYSNLTHIMTHYVIPFYWKMGICFS